MLQLCHDSIIGGHFGIRNILEKVRQKYYWTGLNKCIEQYVKGCDTCNKRKPSSRTKRAPMQITGVGYPVERIVIYILDVSLNQRTEIVISL